MTNCTSCGKKIGFSEWKYIGSKAYCSSCYKELGKQQELKQQEPTNPSNVTIDMTLPWLSIIALQQGEKVVDVISGLKEFFETRGASLGAVTGHRGYLVMTNRRLLFPHKGGAFAKDYAITWGLNLEEIMSVSHGKFGLNDKLIILDKSGKHKDFVAPNSQIAIPRINAAMTSRNAEIETAKRRESVVISLDFSWLKEYMQKGGLVLNTFKCPSCGGSIKIPESGGSAKCEFCGSDVQATDVFKKVKELIG